MVNHRAKNGKRPKGRFSVLSIFCPAVYHGAAETCSRHNCFAMQIQFITNNILFNPLIL